MPINALGRKALAIVKSAARPIETTRHHPVPVEWSPTPGGLRRVDGEGGSTRIRIVVGYSNRRTRRCPSGLTATKHPTGILVQISA